MLAVVSPQSATKYRLTDEQHLELLSNLVNLVLATRF